MKQKKKASKGEKIMPNLTVSSKDSVLIVRIARRAKNLNQQVDQLGLTMDITAAHANGCTLRLGAMLAASDFDFMRDIIGITQNIDRDTGNLENGFKPKFAA
jgi:hypothetical protein